MLGFEAFAFPMDDQVKPTFAKITKEFVEHTKKDVEGLEIKIISVAVLSQYRIGGIKDGVRENRLLQKADNAGLVVDLSITGEVKPDTVIPENFAFADTVLHGFSNNFTTYKSLLQDEPKIINSVTNIGGEIQDRNPVGNNMLTFIYIGCSIAGGVLIAFLSIIFIKFRNNHPGPVLPRDLTFQDENEFIQSQGVRPMPINSRSNDFDNRRIRSYDSQSSSVQPVFHKSFHKSNSHETSKSPRRRGTNTGMDFSQWLGESSEPNNHVHGSRSYQIGESDMGNNTQHDYSNHMVGVAFYCL